MFDRAAILREAHAGARSRRLANRAWRSYRIALADALRCAWAVARAAVQRARRAAEEAAAVVDEDAIARRAALRAAAWAQPFTAAGARAAASLYAEALV